MKKITIFAMLLLVLSLFSGCTAKGENIKNDETKIKVYASFYPLYDFASKIGGDKIDIQMVVPPGAEAHDFEPSPKVLSQMEKSNIVLLNGLGFEPWGKKIKDNLEKKGVSVVELGEIADPIKIKESPEEDKHDHGEYDPHIWLDPIRVIKMGEEIKNELVKIDEKNKKYYENNFNNFKMNLEELDEEYRNTLNNIDKNEIVVSHEAFNYLGERYGLNIISISGISPHDEPSLKELSKLTDIIKEKNIKVVFFEELASEKLSNVLANEGKAQTQVLYTIEGMSKEDMKEGKDYIYRMKENLKQIEKALNK